MLQYQSLCLDLVLAAYSSLYFFSEQDAKASALTDGRSMFLKPLFQYFLQRIANLEIKISLA